MSNYSKQCYLNLYLEYIIHTLILYLEKRFIFVRNKHYKYEFPSKRTLPRVFTLKVNTVYKNT